MDNTAATSTDTATGVPDPFDPELLSRFVPLDSINFPFYPGLYACINEYGSPIYIGQSGNVPQRLKAHRRKRWWKFVNEVRVLPMTNKDQILCAEAVLQLRHRPRYCRTIKLCLCADGHLQEIQFLRAVK